jgi:hypothetical protein
VQAVPFVMFKLFAQKFEKAVVHFVYTSEETCALANQEKHGKSTKKIDRSNPLEMNENCRLFRFNHFDKFSIK